MVTVVCSSQHSLDNFKQHVIKTSGLHKKIEFLGYENKGEFSLTEIYNRGLKEAKNDIVVFIHHDIEFDNGNWGNKLIKLFNENPEFGIIGVAGTKHLADSGKWWEKPKKMYGQVMHTHEGKSWVSKYSDKLDNVLEEVVIVDGLFFAIDKTRIKTTFNEDVNGFHFYDVNFCFENYLKGVKVGVTTLILVNHRSIGITNEEWEKNRIQFSEMFKDKLPITIKRQLRKNERLNILLGCLNFNHFTGSELYTFELAKTLTKLNCDVTICSNIGEPLASMVKKYGVKLYDLKEPPGFKLGDGKWTLNSPQGSIISQPNTLYKLSETKFDVIHLSHKPVVEHLLRLYPDTPVICGIHSEVISLEEPVISEQIKKYIAIRPEIKDYIVKNFNVTDSDISVIYNPFDVSRFKPVQSTKKRDKKRVLFVGTIDYLRKNTIQDLINTTKENNEELWIVGKKNDVYLNSMIDGQEHVKYFEPSFSIEKYIHECDETAGILLGRTTIEGWLCGKKGWIYEVDSSGNILSKKLHDIPADIDKFNNTNVVNQIIEIYKNILE